MRSLASQCKFKLKSAVLLMIIAIGMLWKRVTMLNSSLPIYRPHKSVFFLFFAILLTVVVIALFVGVSEVAFQRIGFTRFQGALLLIGTFLGSSVNIPLRRVKSRERIVEMEEIQFFWIRYRIPHITMGEVSTLITVNVGGAVIPTIVSLYLLRSHPGELRYALMGVGLTAVVVHLVARKVPGLGITTPAFVPPIAAALSAFLFAPSFPSVVAYVAGTLGTLIGADLTNLRDIPSLGAPVASIGGAGTFDGVFLSGLIAVLLV
jgi:uncharacterized membrane protein